MSSGEQSENGGNSRTLKGVPLGREVVYPDHLDPSVLFPIARLPARKKLGIEAQTPFTGTDIWTCYELSWLDSHGIPRVAIAQIEYPSDSTHIIESKSLKLFLGSFNNHRFDRFEDVQATIHSELQSRLGAAFYSITIYPPRQWEMLNPIAPPGTCIDDEIHGSHGEDIAAGKDRGVECVYSNLMRSLCPVTGQPDWATVVIAYDGYLLQHSSLLGYLIAHRSYQGFHEECCEALFLELMRVCEPKSLTVGCFYTRRGGIDINPLRWLRGGKPAFNYGRLARQ